MCPLVMKRNSLSPCEYKTLTATSFQGEFVSMGIISDGNSYGIPDDLLYSFPVTIKVRYYGFFPLTLCPLMGNQLCDFINSGIFSSRKLFLY